MKSKKNDANRTKLALFRCLLHAEKYLTSREISERTGLSPNAMWGALKRAVKGRYIFRKKEKRKHRKNDYLYKYLKPKASRTLAKYEARRAVNPEASLNLNFHYWRDTNLSRTEYEAMFKQGGVRK